MTNRASTLLQIYVHDTSSKPEKNTSTLHNVSTKFVYFLTKYTSGCVNADKYGELGRIRKVSKPADISALRGVVNDGKADISALRVQRVKCSQG